MTISSLRITLVPSASVTVRSISVTPGGSTCGSGVATTSGSGPMGGAENALMSTSRTVCSTSGEGVQPNTPMLPSTAIAANTRQRVSIGRWQMW